jgi:predicted transcriptional regulator
VYGALRDAGMAQREIARELGVNEASVRRGLKDAPPAAQPKRMTVLVLEG